MSTPPRMNFFKRKLALVPVYLLSTLTGYFVGYFLFYSEQPIHFWGHVAMLTLMPFVHLFSVLPLLTVFEHPHWLPSAVALPLAVFSAVRFWKNCQPLFLVLFAFAIVALSMQSMEIFGAMMSV